MIDTDDIARLHFPPYIDFLSRRSRRLISRHQGRQLSYMPNDYIHQRLHIGELDIAAADGRLLDDINTHRSGIAELRLSHSLTPQARFSRKPCATRSRGATIYRT